MQRIYRGYPQNPGMYGAAGTYPYYGWYPAAAGVPYCGEAVSGTSIEMPAQETYAAQTPPVQELIQPELVSQEQPAAQAVQEAPPAVQEEAVRPQLQPEQPADGEMQPEAAAQCVTPYQAPEPEMAAEDRAGQRQPMNVSAAEQPGQPQPIPLSQPMAQPNANQQPCGQPAPASMNQPGQPMPPPASMNQPGQPVPSPVPMNQTGQPSPAPMNQTGQPMPPPASMNQPCGQPAPSPAAMNQPTQPAPPPRPPMPPVQGAAPQPAQTPRQSSAAGRQPGQMAPPGQPAPAPMSPPDVRMPMPEEPPAPCQTAQSLPEESVMEETTAAPNFQEEESYDITGVNLELLSGQGLVQTAQDVETPQPYMLYRREDQAAAVPVQNTVSQELEYFKGLYPASVRRRQTLVDEACDAMEYDRSPMYDEYPDRVCVMSMCDGVCRTASENGLPEERDMMQVLLVNEISRRRLRREHG